MKKPTVQKLAADLRYCAESSNCIGCWRFKHVEDCRALNRDAADMLEAQAQEIEKLKTELVKSNELYEQLGAKFEHSCSSGFNTQKQLDEMTQKYEALVCLYAECTMEGKENG